MKNIEIVLCAVPRSAESDFEYIWLMANARRKSFLGFISRKTVARALEYLHEIGKVELVKNERLQEGLVNCSGFSRWRAQRINA